MLTQLICKRIPVLRNFLGNFFQIRFYSSLYLSNALVSVGSLSSQISYSSVFSKKSMGPEETPVENAIRSVLQELSPVHLEVVNESYMHNVPKGSESHFKGILLNFELIVVVFFLTNWGMSFSIGCIRKI